MNMTDTEKKDGWGWAKNSYRRHYFVDGFSLCGRYHQTTKWDWSKLSPGICMQCHAKLKDIQEGTWTEAELEEARARSLATEPLDASAFLGEEI